jgi:hypothetical protein
LFDVYIPTVNEHLKNLFSSQELSENSVVRKFLITATDGKKYSTKHYNLEAIISLGYRIKSDKATSFRRWATQVLKDFAVRGYVLEKYRPIQDKLFESDFDREMKKLLAGKVKTLE